MFFDEDVNSLDRSPEEIREANQNILDTLYVTSGWHFLRDRLDAERALDAAHIKLLDMLPQSDLNPLNNLSFEDLIYLQKKSPGQVGDTLTKLLGILDACYSSWGMRWVPKDMGMRLLRWIPKESLQKMITNCDRNIGEYGISSSSRHLYCFLIRLPSSDWKNFFDHIGSDFLASLWSRENFPTFDRFLICFQGSYEDKKIQACAALGDQVMESILTRQDVEDMKLTPKEKEILAENFEEVLSKISRTKIARPLR